MSATQREKISSRAPIYNVDREALCTWDYFNVPGFYSFISYNHSFLTINSQ